MWKWAGSERARRGRRRGPTTTGRGEMNRGPKADKGLRLITMGLACREEGAAVWQDVVT